MDMITKSFQTDVSNQYRACRQIFHKTTGAKLIYGFFISLPILLILMKLYIGKGFSGLEFGLIPTWLFIGLLFAYPLILMPIMQFFQVRKAFNSNPSAQQRQNYEITDKGIRNFGDGFNVELSWESIPKIEKSKDFVLLFMSKNCAYYLPKDLVSEQEYQQMEEWKMPKSQ